MQGVCYYIIKERENTQRKGEWKMRTIIYAIFNKETNERIYTNADFGKCNQKLNTLENKENYVIRHKWFSF